MISELVLGFFTNLLYDSFKDVPKKIRDNYEKVYNKAIDEISNKNEKFDKIKIDMFLGQKTVEKAIKEYLKNPNKSECSNVLIDEFFMIFSKDNFSRKEANDILNTFFKVIDSEIRKDSELRDYLNLYKTEQTHNIVEEINKKVEKMSLNIDKVLYNKYEVNQTLENPGKHFEFTKEYLLPTDNNLKSNVPYLRNPFFTGRNKKLKQVHEMLLLNKTVALSQPVAVCGLGGIGKTQIALEYTYLYRVEYKFIFWTNADSEESIISDYVAIARLLNLPVKNDIDVSIIKSAVLNWLETNENWLLVFDNVDKPSFLTNFMPLNPKGHVLLTSRVNFLEDIGNPFNIEIEKMFPDEAREFFTKRTKRENLKPLELKALDELAYELDYLPLAIEQAGAYIRKTECTFNDYLISYKQNGLKLLEKSKIATAKYPKSVATTWMINFEMVEQTSKASADILRVSAFLNPTKIPIEIFIKGAKELGPEIYSALENVGSIPVLLFDVLETLRQYSLITHDSENHTYDIHRLVQAVLRDEMNENARYLWAERAVKAVNSVFPEIEYENWDLCEKLIPHVEKCEEYIKQFYLDTKESAKLLNSTGNYLYERARFQECEQFLNHALYIREKIFDPNHLDIAESLTDSAGIYWRKGKYSEAEALLKRALEIRENVLGLEHPDTAHSMHWLSIVYESEGRFSEAETLAKHSLEIREKVLGLDNSVTAISYNSLAGIYRTLGRYPEAEILVKRAIEVDEKILGADHPSTAISIDNLAALYRIQGKYSEAEPLLKRALKIFEDSLGPDHPDTGVCLDNLASFYSMQRKYIEAEPLFERSQSISEKVFGSDHPSTATSMNNLAALYQQQGKYSKAEQLYKRTLEIREKVLGSNHHDTAYSFVSLATIYQIQGKNLEANKLYLRSIDIMEKSIGENHPDFIALLASYATLLIKMKKGREATKILKRIDNLRAKNKRNS